MLGDPDEIAKVKDISLVSLSLFILVFCHLCYCAKSDLCFHCSTRSSRLDQRDRHSSVDRIVDLLMSRTRVKRPQNRFFLQKPTSFEMLRVVVFFAMLAISCCQGNDDVCANHTMTFAAGNCKLAAGWKAQSERDCTRVNSAPPAAKNADSTPCGPQAFANNSNSYECANVFAAIACSLSCQKCVHWRRRCSSPPLQVFVR